MPPKRKQNQNTDRSTAQRDEAGNRVGDAEEDMETEALVFEDPFGDEYEEEEVEEMVIENDDDEEGMGQHDMQEMEVATKPEKQVWRPGMELQEGETLEYDPSAYVTYHSFRTEWPCLSFDVLRDNLGDGRHRADRADRNKITLLKMSDIHKTHQAQDSDSSDDDESSDEDLDEDPTLEHINIPHQGGVNRLRAMPAAPGTCSTLLASMADTGRVHVFDVGATVASMSSRGPRSPAPTKPLVSFSGHRQEGFALDWSPVTPGRIATGDCASMIHVWDVQGANTPSSKPFSGHTSSIEDLQWSPTEATVFISASADRTVKVWDARSTAGAQISVEAHTQDVNVISWNRSVSYLLASGSDDGSFKVWDLRSIRRGAPLAHFRYHSKPVTSIEWALHDESVLCVSSEDNQVTVWDLSVEADETAPQAAGLADFPPQLLFIHQGQNNVKEVRFHPQIPGLIVSSAEDSFNVFKPAISVSSN